jgi:hypothetical protein
MFVEMTCACGASFQAESDDHETLTMLWAQRFVNSHQECGYMSQEHVERQEKSNRLDINHVERPKEL